MPQVQRRARETSRVPGAGGYLRAWRQRRRMSQLQFALEAEISQRHLSFLESGRAAPSLEMLVHLAERLEVPLRERNAILLAAGYAPIYAERPLDDAAMAAARQAIERILAAHEPYPALAVDRHWHLVQGNAATGLLLKGVSDPGLLAPPVNVLRLGLHPKGMAPAIVNFMEWRLHILERLRHQVAVTGDPALTKLMAELSAYPVAETPAAQALQAAPPLAPAEHGDLFVPLELMTEVGLLTFFSTTTVFGAPADVTLSELALEAFFPANAETKERLGRLAANAIAAG